MPGRDEREREPLRMANDGKEGVLSRSYNVAILPTVPRIRRRLNTANAFRSSVLMKRKSVIADRS